jgi:hypothetical protein
VVNVRLKVRVKRGAGQPSAAKVAEAVVEKMGALRLVEEVEEVKEEVVEPRGQRRHLGVPSTRAEFGRFRQRRA